MAHELGLDKRISTISIDRELHEMIVGKWWQPEDGYDAKGERRYAPAYRRALEEASSGYNLTAEDYQRIADCMRKAMEDRMEKRNSK